MNYLNQLLVPGIIFLLTIGFGIWVARVGKPYNQILFNLHKLIALGGVVLAVLRIIDLDLFRSFPGTVLGLWVAAALGVIGLFASGAAMSIREKESVAVKWFHLGALALLVISGTWFVYLLM